MTSSVRKSDLPLGLRYMTVWGATALMMVLSGTRPWQPAVAQVRTEATLTLSGFGNFFVGGSYDKAHAAQHHIGQMYVQYFIPAERKHSFPIVLIHGGDQTGTGFISTPDGRPGWAQYFVRLGYSVYVVDQVARGRSNFVPEVYGITSGQPLD